MRQYQKLITLAAVVAATTLAGCASRQPASTVVVVPSSQAASSTQATAAIRSGTVVGIQNVSSGPASASQGTSSSGGATPSGAASTEQLLTVQFDDGQRQFFQVAAGGLQFQTGDRITVNTSQGTPVISR